MGTYLIGQTDFDIYRKITGALSKRYDERVKPYVLESQVSDLREILTRDFYDEVIGVAKSGTDNGDLTKANYDALLPHIKPALVYFTWVRLLENNQITATVNSVVQKTNEFSAPISNSQLTKAINSTQSMAQVYVRDMLKFMEDNKDDYPTYYKNISESDTKRTSLRIGAIYNNC